MIIDQVVASLNPHAGGPTRTVLQLSNALANYEDLRVRVISQLALGLDIAKPNSSRMEVLVGSSSSKLKIRLGLPGRNIMSSALSMVRPDIFHCNGIWHPLNHWCSCAARQHGLPLVIQPRGMLAPWALAWKPGKKRLALALYQQRDLETAALLVATAEQEAVHFRQFGLRQPIVVIPNGIDLSKVSPHCRVVHAKPDVPRNALFLGRIHPVKGLLNLLEAWFAVDTRRWVLQLAGPDEGGHLAEVLAAAARLGIADQVQYLGSVGEDDKWQLYRNADLFILPSFTENFAVVVAEALAQELPVITTTSTPWRDLRIYDCGWWVQPSVSGLKDALSIALSSSPQRLTEMGKRGRDYVQRYNWANIAQEMAAAYRWVLGIGPKPKCVWD